MKFPRPTGLATNPDNYKVRKYLEEGDASIERQNDAALLGANAIRMKGGLSNFGGYVMEEAVEGHFNRIDRMAHDQRKYDIMEEFGYQMMRDTGDSIRATYQTTSRALDKVIDDYITHKPEEKTFWEKLRGK